MLGDEHPVTLISEYDGQTISIGGVPVYEIGNYLGGGASGIVYEALEIKTQRHVAIKILHPIGFKIGRNLALARAKVARLEKVKYSGKGPLRKENVRWLSSTVAAVGGGNNNSSNNNNNNNNNNNGGNNIAAARRKCIPVFEDPKSKSLRELPLMRCMEVWGTELPEAGVAGAELIGTKSNSLITASSPEEEYEAPEKYIDFLRERQAIYREIQNMMRVSSSSNETHVNVLLLERVMELVQDSKCTIFLVLELASGGELFDRIRLNEGCGEDVARTYFSQLLAGVEHCHDHGVCHRDLKPENLLLADTEDGRSILKIADFGLSALFRGKIGEAGSSSGSSTGTVPMKRLMSVVGSPHYVAPEVMRSPQEQVTSVPASSSSSSSQLALASNQQEMMQQSPGYDGTKADMWSVGVILYAMLAGSLPFGKDLLTCPRFLEFSAWQRTHNRGTNWKGAYQRPPVDGSTPQQLQQHGGAVSPMKPVGYVASVAHRGASNLSMEAASPITITGNAYPRGPDLPPQASSMTFSDLRGGGSRSGSGGGGGLATPTLSSPSPLLSPQTVGPSTMTVTVAGEDIDKSSPSDLSWFFPSPQLSEAARGLIIGLLDPDPRYRFSVKTAQQHEWLARFRVPTASTPAHSVDVVESGTEPVTTSHINKVQNVITNLPPATPAPIVTLSPTNLRKDGMSVTTTPTKSTTKAVTAQTTASFVPSCRTNEETKTTTVAEVSTKKAQTSPFLGPASFRSPPLAPTRHHQILTQQLYGTVPSLALPGQHHEHKLKTVSSSLKTRVMPRRSLEAKQRSRSLSPVRSSPSHEDMIQRQLFAGDLEEDGTISRISSSNSQSAINKAVPPSKNNSTNSSPTVRSATASAIVSGEASADLFVLEGNSVSDQKLESGFDFDSNEGPRVANSAASVFTSVVKRSTRFVTSVPANQVFHLIAELVNSNTCPLRAPFSKSRQQATIDWDAFRLNIRCDEIPFCTVRAYLMPLNEYPPHQSHHALYILEFSRESEVNIFTFKEFYMLVREHLVEIVKTDNLYSL